ncbi:LIC_10190 family membrane protein [Pseudofulvibacter geojedonensis]|uniref:LIC_10190 family membrane protein n=1 Tax=Pseudofulvibacter geojedonensis TaxID=1123758 RepID=A0ABW3I310_9FLAO
MLYILISWFFMFFISLNFSLALENIINISYSNMFTQHLLGLFLYMIAIWIAAFFIPINGAFYLSILIINTILFFKYRSDVFDHIKKIKKSVKNWSFVYRCLFICIAFILLTQSSTAPYLLDNESYYIQSIKWINEYGFVKGLANLHLFFGQTSGWHILQSGLNFYPITDLLNDLNGYVLLLFSFISIEKLSVYTKEKIEFAFIFGVLFFFAFLMQFINTPSPDIPIFLLCSILFYLFIIRFKNINSKQFTEVLCLSLMVCTIKVTAAIMVIIPIFLFLKHYSNVKSFTTTYSILCIVPAVLFILKNYIISGYILYPLTSIDIFSPDWKQPNILISEYGKFTYLCGFNNIPLDDLNKLSLLEKVKFWLTIPKLHSIFNIFYSLLIVLAPFIITLKKHTNTYWILYLICVSQLILIWHLSPQYRFFFMGIIFLSIFVFISLIKSKKIILVIITTSVIASYIPVFIPIDLNKISTNKFNLSLNTFSLNNLIKPSGISKIKEYKLNSYNNFEFYSPANEDFPFSTGNGKLPTSNEVLIKYIDKHYQYIPRKRTHLLKDGFKSVKTNN